MTMISDWIPLVNFFLLCWLVCWSIITEKRMWYMKVTLERKILSEMSELSDRIAKNSIDIYHMQLTIRETITKVDELVKPQ